MLGKRKRGIEPVISTLLIVMISVAAAGIVGFFTKPYITEKLNEVDSCDNLDLSINSDYGFTCYDSQAQIASVILAKGGKEVDISKVQFIFTFGDSDRKNVQKTDFNPNTDEAYYFGLESFISDPTIPIRLSIAPVVMEKRKERTCDALPEIELVPCIIPEETLNIIEEEIIDNDFNPEEENWSDDGQWSCSINEECGFGEICSDEGFCTLNETNQDEYCECDGQYTCEGEPVFNWCTGEICEGVIGTAYCPRMIECYQETANDSNINDGICDLNYDGSYNLPSDFPVWFNGGSAIYDGNWTSYDEAIPGTLETGGQFAGFNVVYKIPMKAQNSESIWKIKTKNAITNQLVIEEITIPTICWTGGILDFTIVSRAAGLFPPWGRVNYYCNYPNADIPYLLGNMSGTYLYEEAMVWKIQE